jgi:hypothetical protein
MRHKTLVTGLFIFLSEEVFRSRGEILLESFSPATLEFVLECTTAASCGASALDAKICLKGVTPDKSIRRRAAPSTLTPRTFHITLL